MSVVNDIEELANSVKSGLSGSLGEIANTYHALPKELVASATPIGKGVAHFSDSVESVVTREMGQIQKGLNHARYDAIMAQLDNGVDSAGLAIAGELNRFAGVAETLFAHPERFDLAQALNVSADASYPGELTSLLQQTHEEFRQLCSNQGIEPLPQLEMALNAATQMLETMPSHLLSVLEKQIPTASVQSLLGHLQAAASDDKRVGLRALHAQAGADHHTIDYLKIGAKVAHFLEKGSMSLGGALTKELSLKVNGKINGCIGVVAGWAAAVGAKLGIDAKGLQGFGFHVVPFDMAAPYFMAISAFFGILGIGMTAVAECLEVDQETA